VLAALVDLVQKGVYSAASMARIAAFGAPARPRFPERRGDKLLIMGSGPSLRESLRNLAPDSLRDVDLLCVNDFYKEQDFALLRPRLFVIADPAYWDDRCFGEYGGPLIAALAKIDWEFTLLVPKRARATHLHRALVQHRVNFEWFTTAAVRGFGWLESALFGAKLGMPRPQNVLVAAIALGLWAGYRDIAVIGADHSWHQEIDVDDDNMLLTSARHNYTSAVTRKPFLKPHGIWKFREGRQLTRTDVFSMREILLAWAAMHDSYERLVALAARRDVHIFNSSAVSFIDAFERRPLADFLAVARERST
jgi:hypothetical protein